jgi:hypothetical protein
MIFPDYKSDISCINSGLSTMKKSITELQDRIGDGNSIDLNDFNSSISW